MELTGKKFGRWKVVNVSKKWKRGHGNQAIWDCQCQCGKIRAIKSSDLRSGKTKSCGCLKLELQTKHGHSRKGKTSKEYLSWIAMIARCDNKNQASFHNYGGRGIKVCRRWHKFKNFLKDMGLKPSPKHSIERVRVNGNYRPSNCRWATRKEQCNNTRRNRFLKCFGVSKTITQWGEKFSISPITIHYRLKRGWSNRMAITTKVNKKSYERN